MLGFSNHLQRLFGRGFGGGGTRRFAFGCLYLVLPIPPHFFGLAQRNGVEPQRKTLLGWWRPREVSGPARLSHSRGSCHSAAKVSASRTYFITRPRGEGLGLDVDWRLKVFCPAFLQKSGRGPGAEPLDARRSARNSLVLTKRRRGLKGEPSPGVPPLRAAPAICGRPQSSDAGRGWNPAPTGGWWNVAGSAVDEWKGRRGRRPLRRMGNGPRAAVLSGVGHNAGNCENAARMGGVFTRFSRAATKSAFRRGQGIVRAKLSVCR